MNALAQPAPNARPTLPWRGLGALRVTASRLANYLMFLLLLGVIWQVSVSSMDIPAYLLPSPWQTLTALLDNAGAIGSAASFTVICTLIGMSISVVLAMLLALLFIASDLANRALVPLLILIRTVPMIAVAPLIVLVFGRDRWNSIGMVAMLTFFQIMLAAKKGFQAPTANMLEMMHCCGASFMQTLFKVRIPCAVPYLFTGLRITAGSAILCAMFAEWLSGSPGLGTLMLDAYSTQKLALMWATVISSTTVSYLFFTFTIAVERAVLDWSR